MNLAAGTSFTTLQFQPQNSPPDQNQLFRLQIYKKMKEYQLHEFWYPVVESGFGKVTPHFTQAALIATVAQFVTCLFMKGPQSTLVAKIW